jgi:hypothetical protein
MKWNRIFMVVGSILIIFQIIFSYYNTLKLAKMINNPLEQLIIVLNIFNYNPIFKAN